MKLYLASYHFGEDPSDFSNLFGGNKKVAVVANSVDGMTGLERAEKVETNMQEMIQIGLQPIEVDLRDYFDKPKELQKKLDEFHGVWVRGGNTFVLRRAMKYSGMDNYLNSKVKTDYVYGGYSAGVCVICPSLHGIEIVDSTETIPEKYQKEIVWEGVGIIDKMIVPHYKSNHPESYLVDRSIDHLEANNIPYETLKDGEAIIREI